MVGVMRVGERCCSKDGCFDLRQRLRAPEVFLWRNTSPAFIWEQTPGPAAYCAMAGRPRDERERRVLGSAEVFPAQRLWLAVRGAALR